MSASASWTQRLRGFDAERLLGLRPTYPPVALAFESRSASLVRLTRRRGRSVLEAQLVRPLDAEAVPGSMFHGNGSSTGSESLAVQVRALFEGSGTRPGRVSLVLPDNLAKISLLTLPERPPNRRQLEEIVRFKMRRAVPFRLDEAVVAWELLGGEGTETSVLVSVVRRALIEHYERAVEAVGARPGLVDLCTPNLINLCRAQIAAAGEGDVALVNCTSTYFSLVILRQSRLIFFRCKSYPDQEEALENWEALLRREVAGSISYYQEKLAGTGIGTLFVRCATRPLEALESCLGGLGVPNVLSVDPLAGVDPGPGRIESLVAQRLAPAVGAALRGQA